MEGFGLESEDWDEISNMKGFGLESEDWDEISNMILVVFFSSHKVGE